MPSTTVGPFLSSLYLPFLVLLLLLLLLPRPITRRAPRRQPSVSGRRPRRRAFARESPALLSLSFSLSPSRALALTLALPR